MHSPSTNQRQRPQPLSLKPTDLGLVRLAIGCLDFALIGSGAAPETVEELSLRRLCWLVLLLLFPVFAMADVLRIAAAGSLREVLPELIETFERDHPAIQVQARFGASGQLAKQLILGAPDQLFLSADEDFTQLIQTEMATTSAKTIYATGQLVLFRPTSSTLPVGITLADLTIGNFERLAIAQPDNAPYGRAARAVLQEAGLWETIQPKLATAENAAQAAQFAASGNVDLAMIALSQALALQDRGDWTPLELPDQTALSHEMIITDPTSASAKSFFDYLLSAPAAAIFTIHGFAPGA